MFNTIEEVLEDLRQGKMVVVMDDEGRENEGNIRRFINWIKDEIAGKTDLSMPGPAV